MANQQPLMIDEKYERERYWWDRRLWEARMLPHDPPPWSDIRTFAMPDASQLSRSDKGSVIIEAVKTLQDKPDDGWYLVVNDLTDLNGWRYAFDFPIFNADWGSTSSSSRTSDFARQRRWVRKRKVNSQAVTETSTGSDGLPSLANRSVLTAVLTLHNRTDRIVHVAQYEPMPSVDNTWRLRSALFPIGSGETQALQVLLSSRPRVVASVDDSHLPSVVGAQDFDSLVNVDLPEVNASKPVHATPTPAVASTQAAGSSASPVSPRQAQPLSPRQSMSALISPRQQAAGQNAEHMEYYFVLGRTHSRLKALSPVKFSVRVDFWNGVRQKARKELGKSAAARHLHDTAAVRPFTSLHPFETEYVANRRTRVVKPALERLLGMQLEDDEVPTIGFTYSGGGVRAFVTSIGFTHAAIEMGLYDCVSYSGGVSGGSWFQAIWMASRRKFCNVVRSASMVTAFTDKLKKSVADGDADAKGNAASVTTATPAAIASPRRPHNRNSSHGSSNALENFIDDGAKVIDDAVAAAEAALTGAADSFLVVVRNRIAKRPFVHGRAGTSAVYDLILRTCAFRPDHDLSMADVYGGMLGYQWLKEHAKQRLFTVISDQLTLDQPFKPFPIYNAVRPKPAANGGDEPKKDASPLGYQWFEFTPCEVASLQHQAAIPVWAFGRQFDHGKSVSFAPEQSLAVLMGMFGSAFCATIEETNKVVSIPKQLYAMLHALGFSQSRLIKPVMNYNFLYRYKPTSATASTAAADAKADDDGKQAHDTAAANQNPAEDEVFREKHLSLMDAGILVNASLPSFFVPHRQMDIAFVFDARPSEPDVDDSKQLLRPFMQYAEANHVTTPPIRLARSGVDPIHVFEAPAETLSAGATVPTIVYMPLVKDAALNLDFDPSSSPFADFRRFSYDPKHFDTVRIQAYHNLMSQRARIVELLRSTVLRKRAAKAAVSAGAKPDMGGS